MGTEARLIAVPSMGSGSEIIVAHQPGGGLEVRRPGGADVWWLGGPERGFLVVRSRGIRKYGGLDSLIPLTREAVVFVAVSNEW